MTDNNSDSIGAQLVLDDGQHPACLYTPEIRAHEQRARTLLDAARDCEQAEKASRSLDARIEVATGAAVALDGAGRAKSADGKRYRVTAYTASLDAAMTLVPKGYHPNQTGGDPEASDEGRFYVELFPNQNQPDVWKMARASGATFALAICAAALRAIAQTKSEGSQ